jgi:hypothetical protein
MSNFDITIDWRKPSPSTIGMTKRPATFATSRLYDLIDGMINQANSHGEAEVTIRLALNEQTGTQIADSGTENEDAQ